MAALTLCAGGVVVSTAPAHAHATRCDSGNWFVALFPDYVYSHAETTGCRGYLSGTTYYGKAAVEHYVWQIRPGSVAALVHYAMVNGNRNVAYNNSPTYYCPFSSGWVYRSQANAWYKHHGSWTHEDYAIGAYYCLR